MTLCITWTEEREAKLRELHEKGLSASQIAFELGGTTRNSIIGKRHRMGLAPVNPPHKHNTPRAPRNSKNKASGTIIKKIAFRIIEGGFGSTRVSRSLEKSQTVELKCAEVMPLNKELLELDPNDCRFPYGGEDGQPITFCGHQKIDGYSYCYGHKILCLVAPKPPQHRAFTGPMARRAS